MLTLANVAPVGEPPSGSMVDLPGRGSTYVTDTGAPGGGASPKPTLVLLHALACTGALTWYPAIPRLAERYRVVTLDQRWHGRGIRSERFTLEDCADDVAALADALGLERVVPVGYSMGTLVAQLTWRRHRDRVAGLVLCAGTTGFRRAPRERVTLDALNAWMGTLRPGAGRPPGPERPDGLDRTDAQDRAWALRQFRSTSAGAVGRATAEIGKFDSSGWIADVDVPTAVVVTGTDLVIPARRQRWMARQIDGASTYEVDAGHASCVLESETFISGLLPACVSVSSRVRP
ncbi:diacylglycerol O-acyltransferase [Rhodococcus tukisamuensis]|uniref:Diacylglycerol O-acyltransferase n=2 Tax=Rhodococcus tukisamuensis TaxID=168276 RepID=A0A1G6QTX9_9NOCA|nr:diacylglycerol O-acyltransferase [Rhodococcus tukisamuensis]